MNFTFAILLFALATFNLASGAWPPDRPVDRNKLPYKVVCYWGTWAYYRPGVNGKFQAEDVNPNLCTHLNYGFTKLDNNNRIALYDPDLDVGDENWNSGLTWGHGMIRRMNDLRSYNPNLATLISIGGWNEGSNKYSAMVANPASRKVFVDSVVDFLIKYEFDGLDFDWEYPGMKAAGDQDRIPGREADKQDYIYLLEELRAAFEPYGFLLTAAVSAGKPTIDRAYDIPRVSKLLHFINLMTYDFWGGWSSFTGHNAPLYSLEGATGIYRNFTTQFAVDYWIEQGADPRKIIMGIPLYGRTFTLKDPKNNGLGAPTVGKGGASGPITRIIGMLGYNEICSYVKNGWEEHWNETQAIPYATKGNQWVGYDNVKSIQKKVEFLLSRNLGGGMVWSIDTDDFNNGCGEGRYPLLKTITRMLNNVDGPDVKVIRKPYRKGSTTSAPQRPTSTARPWTSTTRLSSKAPTRPSTAASTRPSTQAPTQAPTRPSTAASTRPSTSAPTTAPTVPSTAHPSTSAPSTEASEPVFTCSGAGFASDPVNPKKFHHCVSMGNYLKDFVFTCPGKSVFDPSINVCGHPKNV